MNGERGSSVIFPIYENLDPATSTLTQASDISPVAMTDSQVSIPINEYGNAVQLTALLKATAYTEVGAAASAVVGINRARSVDVIVRDVAVGGSNVMRANGRVTRATLTASTDTLSYNFLMQGFGRGKGWNIPQDDDGTYTAVIHPVVSVELSNLPMWQNVSAYQDKMNVYDGEIGMLAGVRFIESYNAKIYYAGGATGKTATTITASVAAGDTSVTFASNGTGANALAAGDYVTVGTLEAATTEQVQLVANTSGTTWTISGIGNAQGNFGFRYAHAANVAATISDQVVAIPLMGPKSIGKAYSSITGPKGSLRISGPFDVLGRFVAYGWYLIAGWALTSQHWTLRLEAATTLKHIGANQY